jgi:hypothetical protein
MPRIRSLSKDGYCPTADHCEIFELVVESRIFRLRTQMSRVPPKPPSITAASYQPQEETFIPYSYEIGGSIYLSQSSSPEGQMKDIWDENFLHVR